MHSAVAAPRPRDTSVDAQLSQVLARYCRGVDRLDAKLVLSCFVPGAAVDYVGIHQGPIEGFVDFVMASHRRLLGHFHMIGNVLIEDGPDGVHSETYVMITLWKPSADGISEVVVRGRYLDEWQPPAADRPAWRIARRVHHIDLRTVDGRPDHAASTPREAPLP